MIVIVATLTAQAGKEKEMEDALRGIIPKVASEEGTLAYVLHRSLKDACQFLCYEKYKDQASFEFHSSTQHFQELFAKIGPLLAGEPSIEMYEELASM